ncbi:BrnT family toxin [Jiella sp. CBK1P-4]|uniref:BrnT family toxin n=1 Tax=Jiella avicenniae TaxID=2907202 RepID=A0A9X1T5I8_9HYPH|nr:BrnT family toxin [Jiella avicenniae]MCE7028959.1 BrnT family toxin [Jiella avicenniae]
MRFEWDDAKASGNFEKHGVAFVDAAQIFAGPILRVRDERNAYGEERFRAVGSVRGLVLVVIFTRRVEAIRIISAWKAGRNDRRRYDQILADRIDR